MKATIKGMLRVISVLAMHRHAFLKFTYATPRAIGKVVFAAFEVSYWHNLDLLPGVQLAVDEEDVLVVESGTRRTSAARTCSVVAITMLPTASSMAAAFRSRE